MKPRDTARRYLREFVRLAVIIVVVFGARSSLADHDSVPPGSMEDTLMPGDRVVVNKRAYGLRLPFTHVDIRNGRLRVSGVHAATGPAESSGERRYRLNLTAGGGPDFEAVVPDGQLFAVGDQLGRINTSRMFGLSRSLRCTGAQRLFIGAAVAEWLSL